MPLHSDAAGPGLVPGGGQDMNVSPHHRRENLEAWDQASLYFFRAWGQVPNSLNSRPRFPYWKTDSIPYMTGLPFLQSVNKYRVPSTLLGAWNT